MAETPEPMPDVSGVAGSLPFRMLNGMETMRLDANKITAYRGSAVDNTGRSLLSVDRAITADIMVLGVGGRDGAATPLDVKARQAGRLSLGPNATLKRDGAADLPLPGWYLPVYVGRSRDRLKSGAVPAQLILTRMQSSHQINTPNTLAIDASYDVRRSAPIAHYFDLETGFRPMVCYGWPKSFCVWTLTPAGPLFVARDLAGTGELVEIDASAFVPPTGRLLRLQITARSKGGTGDVTIQTLARAGVGLDVLTLNQPGDVQRTTLEFSVTSTGMFRIRVPAGVTVDLVALGFSILQPT
jgi:hypothetical protein